MSRRRSSESFTWNAYRRAWIIPVVVFIVLLITSFRVESPVQSAMPPTIKNDQAVEILKDAKKFDKRFPDRKTGSSGSFDSAQWMREQFKKIGLRSNTQPSTTTSPSTSKSVGVLNVEAVLPGRTRELVVFVSHRDTLNTDGRGGDSVGQMMLLGLAKELSATQDRRRSYMFVSTDAATLNGAGSRALAQRLKKRGGVFSIIVLDQAGSISSLHVDASPSGTFAPPIGLVQIAGDAVASEGGLNDNSSVLGQVAKLAAPVTLSEHGQLLRVGLPAISISSSEGLNSQLISKRKPDASSIGSTLRSMQRVSNTLDQLDQVQTVGKTWVSSQQHVYRGWVLKIFIASLLVPVWVALVDLIIRRRKQWNIFALLGTACRSAIAGVWAIACLWILAAVGVLASSSDHPPNPGALSRFEVFGLTLWAIFVFVGWLFARGPDWRRVATKFQSDEADIVISLTALVLLSVLALSINPFTVLFIIPALHIWLILTVHPEHVIRVRIAAWAAGFIGPLVAVLTINSQTETGFSSPIYLVQLIQTRSVPPLLSLLIGASCGLGFLLLIATFGRVGKPLLPTLIKGINSFSLDNLGYLFGSKYKKVFPVISRKIPSLPKLSRNKNIVSKHRLNTMASKEARPRKRINTN